MMRAAGRLPPPPRYGRDGDLAQKAAGFLLAACLVGLLAVAAGV